MPRRCLVQGCTAWEFDPEVRMCRNCIRDYPQIAAAVKKYAKSPVLKCKPPAQCRIGAHAETAAPGRHAVDGCYERRTELEPVCGGQGGGTESLDVMFIYLCSSTRPRPMS